MFRPASIVRWPT